MHSNVYDDVTDFEVSAFIKNANFWISSGPILKNKGMFEIFQKKGQKIWKFGQKCTRFGNIV